MYTYLTGLLLRCHAFGSPGKYLSVNISLLSYSALERGRLSSLPAGRSRRFRSRQKAPELCAPCSFAAVRSGVFQEFLGGTAFYAPFPVPDFHRLNEFQTQKPAPFPLWNVFLLPP